jgi:ankyrin repeat protein
VGVRKGWNKNATPGPLSTDGGNEAMARLLVERGADVNASGLGRSMGFMFALKGHHCTMAAGSRGQRGCCSRMGPTPTQRNRLERTALRLASESGHEAVVRLLTPPFTLDS